VLKVQESVKSVTSESLHKDNHVQGCEEIIWDGLLNACELYVGHLSANDDEMGDV
jgi:hypothetical protein